MHVTVKCLILEQYIQIMMLMITIIMITTQPIPTTAPIRVVSSQLPTGVCTNNMYSMHVIIYKLHNILCRAFDKVLQ